LPGIAIGLALDAAVQWYFTDDPLSVPPGGDPEGGNEPEPLPIDYVRIPAPPNVANPPSMTYVDPVTGLTVSQPNGTQFYIQGRIRYGQPVFKGTYMSDKQTWSVMA